MSEQLSGYAENTSQHRMEDTRQAEINRLLDERQKVVTELQKQLLDSDKVKKHPDVLAINERLLELTGPRAAGKFSEEIKNQVEGEISSAFEADRTKGFLKVEDFQHMSEGEKFIYAGKKKIIDLHHSLITEVIPQITDQKAQGVIKGRIEKFNYDHLVLDMRIKMFDNEDDLGAVQANFAGALTDLYDRLHDIYIEAYRCINNN